MTTKQSTISPPMSGSLEEVMLRFIETGVNKRSQTIHYEPVPYDMLAQCPKCKSMETVQFVNRTLTKRSRFFQKNGKVYHDCGSDRPCQLFR